MGRVQNTFDADGRVRKSRTNNKKPFRITRNGILQPCQVEPGSGLKRFPTTAGLPGIRIGDFESAAIQAIDEIDHGSSKIVGAERIHQNGNARQLHGFIIRPFFIENHAVLHPRTAASFNINPKPLASTFVLASQESFDFVGGTLGHFHDGFGWRGGIHIIYTQNLTEALNRVKLEHAKICPKSKQIVSFLKHPFFGFLDFLRQISAQNWESVESIH